MGASQSSTNGDSAATKQDIKTSYYELLSISRDATEEEIKRAYKKAALRLHPDRNLGNVEAATKTFAEVAAAYEVLSDPQERAWYDSHEAAILRGDDSSATEGDEPTYEDVRVTSADDLARLVRKFNKNVDFTDAPTGFFGFLRETFDRLAQEEQISARIDNVDVRDYPSFGMQHDRYDDSVKQFYSAWSSFSTVKSFSWKDKYRLAEAPDRWYRRRMESENNRLRSEAKREFNEAVRALVAFVKKRDPRYEPNTQSEAERQQALREATAAQAARARAANEAKINSASIPEWTKIREPEDEEDEESEDEIEEEVFECVSCDKIFKSERQWEAHEKSKKHQKAVKALQRKMQKENVNLDLDADTPDQPDGLDEIDGNEGYGEEDHVPLVQEDGDHGRTESTKDNCEESKNTIVDTTTQHEPSSDNEESSTERQGSKNEEGLPISEGSPITSEDEDYAAIEVIQARMQSSTFSISDDDDEDHAAKLPQQPKKGKAAQKRAKKAAAAAAAASEQGDVSLKCEVCAATFPSKNKLFDHISREGHAAAKADVGGKSKKKKGKR